MKIIRTLIIVGMVIFAVVEGLSRMQERADDQYLNGVMFNELPTLQQA